MATQKLNLDGRVAYEAYIRSCPVSKFTGEKLPSWDQVDKDIKKHWSASERAVVLKIIDDVKKELS